MKTLHTRIAATILIVISTSATQAEPYPTEKQDFNKLPEYCSVKMAASGRNASEAEVDQWKKVLAEGYMHIHHYCAAMHSYQHVKSIFATTKQQAQERRHFLNVTLNNVEYIEERVTDTFILLPDVLLLKANVLYDSGKQGAAISTLERTIMLKPDYMKTYKRLSDFYKKQKDYTAAKKQLERGLEVNPKSRSLKRALKKINKLQKESKS